MAKTYSAGGVAHGAKYWRLTIDVRESDGERRRLPRHPRALDAGDRTRRPQARRDGPARRLLRLDSRFVLRAHPFAGASLVPSMQRRSIREYPARDFGNEHHCAVSRARRRKNPPWAIGSSSTSPSHQSSRSLASATRARSRLTRPPHGQGSAATRFASFASRAYSGAASTESTTSGSTSSRSRSSRRSTARGSVDFEGRRKTAGEALPR